MARTYAMIPGYRRMRKGRALRPCSARADCVGMTDKESLTSGGSVSVTRVPTREDRAQQDDPRA